MMTHYPIAGAGLTGEPFIEREVTNLYLRSRYYSAGWQIVTPATELLINYFWLHWIYLGLVWGVIIMAAMTAWLGVLGVPSPAFCWGCGRSWARHRAPMSVRPAGPCCSWRARPPSCTSARPSPRARAGSARRANGAWCPGRPRQHSRTVERGQNTDRR